MANTRERLKSALKQLARRKGGQTEESSRDDAEEARQQTQSWPPHGPRQRIYRRESTSGVCDDLSEHADPPGSDKHGRNIDGYLRTRWPLEPARSCGHAATPSDEWKPITLVVALASEPPAKSSDGCVRPEASWQVVGVRRSSFLDGTLGPAPVRL